MSKRSFGYLDNNSKVQTLNVAETDTEVNAEQAALIMVLDRIATALEEISGQLRREYRGSGNR